MGQKKPPGRAAPQKSNPLTLRRNPGSRLRHRSRRGRRCGLIQNPVMNAGVPHFVIFCRNRVAYNLGRMEVSELLKKALALPDHERAELAGNLIDSLDTTVDEDAEAAWQEEIARRLNEVETGKVKTVPWDEVRRKGRALLNRK
jgi:putative addiction module component (TIGR02574 family)